MGLGLLALAMVCPAISQEDARSFSVTYTALGPDGQPDIDKHKTHFVSRLGARPSFAAGLDAARRAAGEWKQPRSGTDGPGLSLVTVSFGPRTDWLAFIFEPEGGKAILTARRQGVQRNTAGIYLKTIPPGPDQVDRNAAIELAADVGNLLATGAHRAQRETLQVRVAAAELPQSASADALSLDRRDDSDLQASQPAPKEIQGFLALTFAAAGQAGWQPTEAEAANLLDLSVTRNVLSYTVRATLRRGTESVSLTKPGIPRNFIFEHLYSLVVQLSRGQTHDYDFGQAGEYPLQLVALNNGNLVVQQRTDLRCIDISSGNLLWEVKPAPTARVDPIYVARGAGDETALWRHTHSLAVVSIHDGGLVELPRGSGESQYAWGFDVGAQGRAAVAKGNTVRLVDEGKELWKFRAEHTIACGPLMTERGIVVAALNGQVALLSLSDGTPLWQTRIEGRPRGPITMNSDTVILATIEGRLVSLGVDDGAARWQTDLGDALLGRPRRLGARLLVPCRNNTVNLIDARTGRVEASRALSDWLVGACPVLGAGLVACATRQGKVELLSDADLSVRRTIDLATGLSDGMLASAAMPSRWGTTDVLAQETTGLVVSDDRGFVFLIRTNGEGPE